MSPYPPAVSRRRAPGPVLGLLVTWASVAVVGGLAGLVLAVSDLLSTTPLKLALGKSGFGLFSGAVWGSVLAIVLLTLYFATSAL